MNKQRQALIKVLAVGYYGPNSPLHKIIYEALAEPEQEPVADSDLYAVWLNGLHSRKPLTEPELVLDDRASNYACHIAWKQCADTIDKFDGDPYGAFTMGFHAGIRASVNAKHPPAKPAAYLDLSNDIAYSMRELSNEDAYDTDAMVPLYTSPPTRKPLTDEQIDAAWRSVDYTQSYAEFRIAIARAVERAHGITE